MTREEFKSKLMDAREPRQYERVFSSIREQMRGLDDGQQFDILFPLAVKNQSDAPSSPASDLLRELSPTCPLACEDAVKALLPEWEVSIEEVPFYLAARFGLSRVRQAVVRIEPEITNESQRQRLKTVAYWLDRYEEAYCKACNQSPTSIG